MKPSYVEQEEELPPYLKQEALDAEIAYNGLTQRYVEQLSSSTGECTLKCRGLAGKLGDRLKSIVGYEENKTIARLKKNGINPFSEGFSSVIKDIDIRPEKIKVGRRA